MEGLNEVNAQYQKEYGPGNYVPNVFIQYWSMRVMAYLGALVLLLALWGAWAVWRHRLERSRWFLCGRHLGRHRPVLHEHGRLAADRERPPALDRPGPHADQGRGVHLELVLGRHHLGRVRVGVRRLRRHRRGAHGPLRAPGPVRGRGGRGGGRGRGRWDSAGARTTPRCSTY